MASIPKEVWRRAIITGAMMEGPIFVAGAVYLAGTGLYTDPMAIIALVFLAGIAGVAAAGWHIVKYRAAVKNGGSQEPPA
ncbi:MAG: hypothetical protein AAGD34_08545 [Pseudomonadota bacterium]